ncbi:alpha-amylase family glycosyl hydrolase [Candidatus Hodarchaeum mangrovi]
MAVKPALCGLIILLLIISLNSSNSTLKNNYIVEDSISKIIQPTYNFDNNIEWDLIYHNTREGYYRSPGWATTDGWNKSGAVRVGQNVILRIRSAINDLTRVQIRYWDGEAGVEGFREMTKIASTSEYDFWEGTILSPLQPSDYFYSFFLTDGTETDYYSDDEGLDGGVGKMYASYNSGRDFGIVFYDPGFTTPDWHKQTVGYQIFLDRFFNGDLSNDAIGDGSSGDITWFEWDSNGDGSFTSEDAQRVFAIKRDWTELPTGGNDFFGGDLKGVFNKIDYLKDLGIGFIWLNPFTESPDNHGYSVDNYKSVDPYYGSIAARENGIVRNNITASLKIFDELESTLELNGIKIIYDVVINHVSAQSIYFQRFENMDVGDLLLPTAFQVPDPYPYVKGAYEGVTSLFNNWFRFYTRNHDYDAWWGFYNIPTLKYDQTMNIATELITGANSLFTFWANHGVDGFRLDVNPDYDDGTGSRVVNKLIRDRVKVDKSDNIIIGEVWDRANTWLTGTMNDGVQNMLFRDNTIIWIRGTNVGYTDNTYINKLVSFQDFYPPEAYHSLWTNLGNHDTARILTELEEINDRVLLAAALQFFVPGVPVIYYGDEIGLPGVRDPDSRRPFPWGSENQTMLKNYKDLIQIRKNYKVFQRGSFFSIEDQVEGVLSFGRELSSTSQSATVGIFNRNKNRLAYLLNLSTFHEIQVGDVLVDLLNNNTTYIVDENKSINLLLEPYGRMILLNGISDPLTQSTSKTISQKSSNFSLIPLQVALLTLILSKKLYTRRTKRKRKN